MIVAQVQATDQVENRLFVDENTKMYFYWIWRWSIDGLIYLIIPEIDTFVIYRYCTDKFRSLAIVFS